jgi:hypothetical protein
MFLIFDIRRDFERRVECALLKIAITGAAESSRRIPMKMRQAVIPIN